MWKYSLKNCGKEVHTMTALILSVKKTLQGTSSPISLSPSTDYHKHVPQSAEQLMGKNWAIAGKRLFNAMKKVGDEIEKG